MDKKIQAGMTRGFQKPGMDGLAKPQPNQNLKPAAPPPKPAPLPSNKK